MPNGRYYVRDRVVFVTGPARGIGAETARHMLIRAFAGEIIERIRHAPARKEMDELVWERLEANPHLAQNK